MLCSSGRKPGAGSVGAEISVAGGIGAADAYCARLHLPPRDEHCGFCPGPCC